MYVSPSVVSVWANERTVSHFQVLRLDSHSPTNSAASSLSALFFILFYFFKCGLRLANVSTTFIIGKSDENRTESLNLFLMGKKSIKKQNKTKNPAQNVMYAIKEHSLLRGTAFPIYAQVSRKLFRMKLRVKSRNQ